jgi:hypothetical protein
VSRRFTVSLFQCLADPQPPVAGHAVAGRGDPPIATIPPPSEEVK